MRKVEAISPCNNNPSKQKREPPKQTMSAFQLIYQRKLREADGKQPKK